MGTVIMNRLCIYVTYNKENKIEEYMGYMLKALREHVTALYVVCNYPKILDGVEYIEPYADGIFYRENIGYDAGAYKDMLCSMLGWDKVYQYDELILLNDSFFGPFYDMKGFFDLMQDEACDFWGMTRNFSGKTKSGYFYKPHIQSYFLVFRRDVMHSTQFRDFWDNIVYPETFEEAIINFEIRINECLNDYGFVSKAFTDVWGITFEANMNPCVSASLELIRDNNLPILKKKNLIIKNSFFPDVIKAVEFLEVNNLYPTDLIWNMMDKQFSINESTNNTENCLELFYNKYNRIYFYGAGLCAKHLVLYFKHKGWKWEGFLVSDKTGQDLESILFDDVYTNDDIGIIVSVFNQDVSKEIVQHIGTKCRREQLFIIYDCEAIRVYD